MAFVVAGERGQMPLEFAGLEALPCGCVTAAYRARPWDVLVCSVEAKGPLCPRDAHVTGLVVHLGDPVG
jgi:hypothetical protein